ncbi:TonB-dependent receptor domain-containing protein [Sphingobacterium psychroaquaticum]|uniref:TonB-dependent receptor domain-containing protein n=1 Tax=Sphingobacterium psychroaquaticum TaxID=561061 RepID=UPI0019D1451C|nr:TonB-dependent receptor [Sphingobacterium psychroaquaticum]
MLLCVLGGHAQQPSNFYKGLVRSNGQPVPDASVKIDKKTIRADENGAFTFSGVSGSSVDVSVSALGFQHLRQALTLGKAGVVYTFSMQGRETAIDEVSVLGFTPVKEVNRQAYNVTAIDATKLYNTTMNIANALDRVAGVRVRESGGVGSNFNLSLNGFSGNHVRYFIDGIPMDNMGSSFQINNIPINLAERVEVYKGVVPIWLGSDALGGAINIVTSMKPRNFVDASYSYGSFNTHRTVVNLGTTSKSGFTFLLNAYQNFSDNDYKVTLSVADINTGAYSENIKLRRFHDQYHNEAVVAQVGVVNKPYADRLLVGFTAGKNYKEIQADARMKVAYGGIHRRGTTLMPTLKYQKMNLIDGLDVTVNANYNFGTEKNIDTLDRRFGWFGESKPNPGGERSKQLYVYKNNEGIATLAANYKVTEKQSIALSSTATTFKREGENELNPQANNYEVTKRTFKNMMGLGYSYDVKDVWSATLFGKYIFQSNKDGDRPTMNMNRFGYGLATTYFLDPEFQLKASYELTNRMATAYELFGDVENQDANPDLKPERSHNINLGAYYGWKINEDHRFRIGGNLIYRYAFDFIFTRLNNNQSKLIADNREGVSTRGADMEFNYSYKNFLTLGGSLTYQYLQNKQEIEPGYTGVSPLFNAQMPNIPYLFGNTDLGLVFRDFGKKGNVLNVNYNLLYVHRFWLYWPTMGGTSADDKKREVPGQLAHDLRIGYSLNNGRYNIGAEIRNIADAQLYDNFGLQKPGRSFAVNLRYYFQQVK